MPKTAGIESSAKIRSVLSTTSSVKNNPVMAHWPASLDEKSLAV